MQVWNTFPTTSDHSVVDICVMANAKKGTRKTTPTEFKALVAARIAAGRAKIGWTHQEMAQRLSLDVRRDIPSDTYRKWETVASQMPLDVLLPFCELTRIHIKELLHPEATAQDVQRQKQRGKLVA